MTGLKRKKSDQGNKIFHLTITCSQIAKKHSNKVPNIFKIDNKAGC